MNARFGVIIVRKFTSLSSIDIIDWTRTFENLSINDQVERFNETLLNILRNFIPHQTIKCSHKDLP